MVSMTKTIAVLFSPGGLGDVGRHAVRAALDYGSPNESQVSRIVVFAKDPASLDEANWNSPGTYSFTAEERQRLKVVQVDVAATSKDAAAATQTALEEHLQGVDAVISCLGTRQPFFGHRVGTVGTERLVQAMTRNKIQRLIAISSVGIGDDWPPMEWTWVGKYFFVPLFSSPFGWREYRDLSGVERAVVGAADIDHVIVRPVGVGEDKVPVNEWFLQQKKFEDTLGLSMAKLDCARFMVKEAMAPTLHKRAVVIGPKPSPEEGDNSNGASTK